MTATTQDLDGRTAAITGASSGIGATTARRLASEGMDVALGARRGDRLKALAGELEDTHDVQVLPVEVDVTSMDAVQGFADRVEAQLGGVDVLFANAGTGGRGEVREISEADFEQTLDVNLVGAFRTAKAFLPLIEGREGTRSIVFTASVSGTMGMAGASAYCASKWGLRGFAQSLALEVADDDVRVTAINPGLVNTRWHEDHPRTGEMIQPEDIAEMVVTLATMPPTAMVGDVTVWPAKMYTE